MSRFLRQAPNFKAAVSAVSRVKGESEPSANTVSLHLTHLGVTEVVASKVSALDVLFPLCSLQAFSNK